jgi:hypothetical protein
MPDVGQPKGRDEKHVEIENGMAMLDAAITRLGELLERVRGGNKELASKDVPERVTPSLAETLEQTPAALQGRAERIDNIRCELAECLF